MVNWFCGFIWGSAATLLLYSLFVGKEFRKNKIKRLNVFSNMKNTGEESEHWQMKTKV